MPGPVPTAAVYTCPGRSAPAGLGGWDGALCPAVLQRAQGGARVSPPGAGCSAPSAERLRSPLSLLRPLCQLPGRTTLCSPPPSRRRRRRPWSARGGRRDSRRRRGRGPPEPGRPRSTPALWPGGRGDPLSFSEPRFSPPEMEARGAGSGTRGEESSLAHSRRSADAGPGEAGTRVTSVARKKHAPALSRPRSEGERDPCPAETPVPASPRPWSQPEAAPGL